MDIKKSITVAIMAFVSMAAFAAPEVTDVVAKQRYPWNGLVDITCTVSGISETDDAPEFVVAAVYSGRVYDTSQFWVVRNGTNSTDRTVHTNGMYHLVWDSKADFDKQICSNMVVRVNVVDLHFHDKVQLWEGGPYWATTNIGAEEPWEYGYYFWWGDTVGYKREGNAWVATDGSSSNFRFYDDPISKQTYNKIPATLQIEGWVVFQDGMYVLAPEHDAAQVQWGGGWRMPTEQEQEDLCSKCDWTWTTMNGVDGYVVRGRGDYAANSIFLPCAGRGDGTSLSYAGSCGYDWSSVPRSGYYDSRSWSLRFGSGYHSTYDYDYRCNGFSVRPVQGFTK